ncbi:regulator, partial [Streptomyces anulatus]
MEREPNRSLQRLIAESGFTHKGLARRLNDLGVTRGLSGLKYDHSSVLRWIGGQRPRDPVPALLAEVFSLRLGRTVGVEDIGLPAVSTRVDLGQEFTHTWQEGIATVTALWRGDVERRRFLLDSTFALGAGSTGALRWLTLPAEGRPAASGPRRVGMADIAAIREVTRSFGELDNRFGGGRVRSAVVRYLDTAVAPLLNEGSYAEATGGALASAAAELTRLAGWMAYDLEQHGLAQRYLIQALRLARGAGDHGLGGEILAGMSHQALYIGQP